MNTTEYRNLAEQVLKNKNDILKHFKQADVLADFGIRIIGQLESKTELDEVPTTDLQYGDAYAIGTQSPFDYYIWTRANNQSPEDYWFEFGKITIAGPQGPKGDRGERGEDGKSTAWHLIWSVSGTYPDFNVDDLILETSTGTVYRIAENKQAQPTINLKGPAGPQGKQGIQGPAGPTGSQGPKGDAGDVGGFLNIAGVLSNVEQLPDPNLVDNPTIAYLIGSSAPYDLYIQAGTSSATARWLNTGPLNAATLVTVANQFQNIWNADTKVDKVTTPGTERVYTVGSDGSQGVKGVSTTATPLQIPVYDGIGRLSTATPSSENHCANKGYVDGKVGSPVTRVYPYINFPHECTSGSIELYNLPNDKIIQLYLIAEYYNMFNSRTATVIFNPVMLRTSSTNIPGYTVDTWAESTDSSDENLKNGASCSISSGQNSASATFPYLYLNFYASGDWSYISNLRAGYIVIADRF